MKEYNNVKIVLFAYTRRDVPEMKQKRNFQYWHLIPRPSNAINHLSDCFVWFELTISKRIINDSDLVAGNVALSAGALHVSLYSLILSEVITLRFFFYTE